MLGTDADQAVLLFGCTSYDENDRIIEFFAQLYPGR